jgi:glycine/D-amino acid oxidase-like deaminating enzyme
MAQQDVYDVLVVGGGFAGVTAAREAALRHRSRGTATDAASETPLSAVRDR